MKVQIGLCEKGSLIPVVVPTHYLDILPRIGDVLAFLDETAPYGVKNEQEWRRITNFRSFIVVEVRHTFEGGDISYFLTAQLQ